MKPRFWLVWADGGGRPTYKHPTRASAEAEAARLARQHGGVFHVLECVGTCERPTDVTWTFCEPILRNPPVDEAEEFAAVVRQVNGYNEGSSNRPRRPLAR